MASSSRAAKEAKAEKEGTIGPNWLELPRELTTNILQRLGTVEIVTSSCRVCPLWWNICKDPFMWRTIHITNICTSTYNMDNLDSICCYAVERSCGHLEDIDIELFCTDKLLNYIADSSSNLRRIRLAKCQRFWPETFSPNVFNELVKKLPLLVEVDISFSNLPADSLEVIGRSCPLLKSLKHRKFHRVTWAFASCNNDAFAIAKTMPKLRHLDIFAHFLTNVGLLAILDGCPLLESLDLR